MKAELLDPTLGNPSLEAALSLGRLIYQLHEAGQGYSNQLKQLGLIVRHPIHAFAVDASFGSESSDTFARKQLIDWEKLPGGLSQDEMLEMIQRVINGDSTDFQTQYWVKCLQFNTGDKNIVSLIFWPSEYFKGDNNSRQMSPAEILKAALSAGLNNNVA